MLGDLFIVGVAFRGLVVSGPSWLQTALFSRGWSGMRQIYRV